MAFDGSGLGQRHERCEVRLRLGLRAKVQQRPGELDPDQAVRVQELRIPAT